MKINWKQRFKNGAFVLTFATTVIAFIYQMLSLFGIVPSISEDMVVKFVSIVVTMLAGVGVVTDPTTKGLKDSDRAMTYGIEEDEEVG